MPDTSVGQNLNSKSSVSFLTRFLATGFFSGYSPIIPGTAGSLVGLAIYAILGVESLLPFSLLILFMFGVGVIVSSRMEKYFGDDPTIVVIDEIVGMWISLFFLPKTISIALIAFFFFRIYDIFKPPPARQIEVLKHGWGIMLDDVVAGIYANLTVQLLRFIIPGIY